MGDENGCQRSRPNFEREIDLLTEHKSSARRKRPVSPFMAAIALTLAVVVGTTLIILGLNVRRTAESVNVDDVPRVLRGLGARPPTQRGYDLALSIAKHEHASEVDLVSMVLRLTDMLVLGGAALFAVAGMFLYAWYVRKRELNG